LDLEEKKVKEPKKSRFGTVGSEQAGGLEAFLCLAAQNSQLFSYNKN
jgi:hypothetical protein